MSTAQQSATERALADRDKQYRLYRAGKRTQYAELFAIPEHGEILRKFFAMLQHFGRPDDADNMVAYVHHMAPRLKAHDGIRHAALEMIDNRIQRIRVKAGLAVFDDPLPGEEDDVFQLCKKALSNETHQPPRVTSINRERCPQR